MQYAFELGREDSNSTCRHALTKKWGPSRSFILASTVYSPLVHVQCCCRSGWRGGRGHARPPHLVLGTHQKRILGAAPSAGCAAVVRQQPGGWAAGQPALQRKPPGRLLRKSGIQRSPPRHKPPSVVCAGHRVLGGQRPPGQRIPRSAQGRGHHPCGALLSKPAVDQARRQTRHRRAGKVWLRRHWLACRSVTMYGTHQRTAGAAAGTVTDARKVADSAMHSVQTFYQADFSAR